MKHLIFLLTVLGVSINSYSQQSNTTPTNTQERNKELVRNFYQDLWFSNNTDNYAKYVAREYVVHDIGDRKGVTEPAIEQKNIADFFWENGSWENPVIYYQIAEGDLVATRWETTYNPSTLLGKIAIGSGSIPVINVFRINKEGKIVEIWNHRHDIDTQQTLKFTLKGLIIGLLIALIPTILAIRLKRKLKYIQK